MTAGAPSGWLPETGVTDFDTKLAVVVRDDLAAWQAVDGVVRGLARHP